MNLSDVTVGTPATFKIGADKYATVVTKVTKATITIEHADLRVSKRTGKILGDTTRGWCSVYFGKAEDYRDPSF